MTAQEIGFSSLLPLGAETHKNLPNDALLPLKRLAMSWQNRQVRTFSRPSFWQEEYFVVLGGNPEQAKSSLLMRSMPEDVADKLLEGAVTQRFDHGASLFLQGEKAGVIYIVLEGWVKLFRISPNGNEAVVGVFTKGHSFGEAVALQALEYPVSAEAVTDCTVLTIKASALISLMKAEPEICLSVLASTFQHLHSLVTQIEQIKAQTGAQRVAEFLLDLAPVDSGSCMVTLPYDKVLIAGRLGMKPESLSRAFSKLRALGVRIEKNHASIEDVGRLKAYVEIDPALAWSQAL